MTERDTTRGVDHWLYVISYVDPPAILARTIKIGISVWPEKRLSQLQTGSPFTIALTKVWGFVSEHDAKRVEGHCHEWFETRRRRRKGEWVSGRLRDVESAIDDYFFTEREKENRRKSSVAAMTSRKIEREVELLNSMRERLTGPIGALHYAAIINEINQPPHGD